MAKGSAKKTRCTGRSSRKQPLRVTQPIRKRPAGMTTISGPEPPEASASANALPGRNGATGAEGKTDVRGGTDTGGSGGAASITAGSGASTDCGFSCGSADAVGWGTESAWAGAAGSGFGWGGSGSASACDASIVSFLVMAATTLASTPALDSAMSCSTVVSKSERVDSILITIASAGTPASVSATMSALVRTSSCS